MIDTTPAYTLHLGDNLSILRQYPDDSLDSMVTDPPAGIAFMGKVWDQDHGGRLQWVAAMAETFKECLRVIKPGGHALVWALPRTSHWTACALEDAGWEIRDIITHITGQGFPKSHNIEKSLEAEIIKQIEAQGIPFTGWTDG